MKDLLAYIIIYLILMSLYGAALVIVDKSRAIKRRRRIPEKAMLLVGLIGGAGGMFPTMKIVHHKTRVKKFMVLLPIFLIVHLIILIVFVVLAFMK